MLQNNVKEKIKYKSKELIKLIENDLKNNDIFYVSTSLIKDESIEYIFSDDYRFSVTLGLNCSKELFNLLNYGEFGLFFDYEENYDDDNEIKKARERFLYKINQNANLISIIKKYTENKIEKYIIDYYKEGFIFKIHKFNSVNIYIINSDCQIYPRLKFDITVKKVD